MTALRPDIRHVRSGGAAIAYQGIGIDLVWVLGLPRPVCSAWNHGFPAPGERRSAETAA